MTDWISVNDQLPPIGQKVLIAQKVATDYLYFISYMYAVDCWGGFGRDESIKFWMPIPFIEKEIR